MSKTIRTLTRPRSVRAFIVALTALALSVIAAAPASAATTGNTGIGASGLDGTGLENDCKAWALTDRKDGSTSTYGAGGLNCEHDNYLAIEMEIKLYKNGKLVLVHRSTCKGPPVKTCSVNTPTTPGSRGTWKTVTTGWAQLGGSFKYTASHSKTW